VPTVQLEKEKEKATAGVFAERYTVAEALDTAADIYHGVRPSSACQVPRGNVADRSVVCLLVRSDQLGLDGVV
jgi:hypothetical protein